MVTKTKAITKSRATVAVKKPAVKKVGRSGQTAGAAKPVVTDKTKNTAVVNGVPTALIEKAPKGRAAAKKKMFAQAQTAAMAQPVIDHIASQPKQKAHGISGSHVQPGKLNNSSISGAHVPSDGPLFTGKEATANAEAMKAAVEKLPKARRTNHDSPLGNKAAMAEIIEGIQQAHVSEKENAKFLDLVVAMVKDGAGRFFGVSTYERLIRAALTAEQIKTRKPLFMGLAGALTREQALAVETHPDTEKDAAVTAEIKELLDQRNPENLTREDVSRLVSREVEGDVVSTRVHVQPHNFLEVLTAAFDRSDETLQRFRPQERSALRAFVLFFERFWGVIENRQVIDKPFQKDSFQKFVIEDIPGMLEHGEYARFTFGCGSRVIIHNTMAGAATLSICESDFMSFLRVNPTISKEEVEVQAQMNPPGFVFWTTIMSSLSALVRCDVDQPGLSLMVLNRVFGDPINYVMRHGEFNLAQSVEDTLDHLVDLEARTVRKAA